MAKISTEVVDSLKSKIDSVTNAAEGIPGTVFVATNKKGDVLFEHASGKIGAGRDEPMTMDSVFWIASCTKMITGIACMQLVEQGKLALDDVEQVEKIAPELKAVQVLDEGGKLVDKKKGITLRMLLNHTAGFGYSFFSQKLVDYYGAKGADEFSGLPEDMWSQPLVNQPGERWEYGINIDWAGHIVERVSGLSLDEYFQKHILGPMGLKNITFFPGPEMQKHLTYMNQRNADGKLSLRDDGHLLRRPLVVKSPEEIKATVNSGGGGGFGTPKEYCQVISMLLNDGVHAPTGKRILKAETVKEMFTNQIPDMPNFGRQTIPAVKPRLVNSLPSLYPDPDDVPQGWGLTFFLHLHATPSGRSAGTAYWAGLANCFWWADRENGLGGMITTQIIPFGDMQVMGLWAEVEAALYQAIEGGKKQEVTLPVK